MGKFRPLWYFAITVVVACFLWPALGFAAESGFQNLEAGLELEGAFTDETLTSTDDLLFSGGSLLPLERAPHVATVITAEDIAASGAQLLSEALEMVPGLHVGLTNYGRAEPLYSIRGIHTRFNPEVLILVDGQPLTSFSGSRSFAFRMPVKAIERIEVIRGPGSAVYGADAFSGVIHVFTKDAQDINGTVAGAGQGSFDTNNLYLQHGKTYGELDVALSFEWLRTDGDDDRRIDEDVQSQLDAMLMTSASRAPGSLSTGTDLLNTHLDLTYQNWNLHYWFSQNRNSGLGVGLALALDPKGDETIERHSIDLGYSRNFGDWETGVDLHYAFGDSESRFNLFPPGAVLPIDGQGNINFAAPVGMTLFPDGTIGEPTGEESFSKVDLTTVYSGWSDHRLRLAAGYSYQKLEAGERKNFGPGVIDGSQMIVDGTLTDVSGTEFIFVPKVHRNQWYLSAQEEWFFARGWSLTGGLRYDEYDGFGDTLNPRLALVWEARDELTVKMLYGRAFRAPTFTELYTQNNPAALGNKDVDPETIDTVELAFSYRPSLQLQTKLNLFSYWAKDLIEFLPTPAGVIQAQNARDQEGYGAEFEVDWQLRDALRLRANLSYQHSKDSDTKERVPDAPAWSGFAILQWEPAENWEFSPSLVWVADRRRAEGDPRSDVDDYALVNLVLNRRDILSGYNASVTMKNVFDTTAYEPSAVATINDDFPLAGRSVFAELSYRF